MSAIPIAYGYCRVSTEEQANSGLSIDAQKEAIEKHFERLKVDHPGIRWGGHFVDPAVSGSVKILMRPAGRALQDRLTEGDFIIAAKVDRVFRDLEDCVVTNNLWIRTGIKPCYLDVPCPADHEMFIPQVVMMGIWAQTEAVRIRKRIKEAKQQQKQRGEAVSICPPIGHEFYMGRNAKGQIKKMVRPDPYARRCAGYIISMRQCGYSFSRIAAVMNQAELKPPQSNRWTMGTVSTYYHWGKESGVIGDPAWKETMSTCVSTITDFKPPRGKS